MCAGKMAASEGLDEIPVAGTNTESQVNPHLHLSWIGEALCLYQRSVPIPTSRARSPPPNGDASRASMICSWCIHCSAVTPVASCRGEASFAMCCHACARLGGAGAVCMATRACGAGRKAVLQRPTFDSRHPPRAEPPAQLKAEPDAMADGGDGGGVPGSRISVMVTDPKKEQEGINAYVSYKVVTRSDMPGFAPEKFVIRRSVAASPSIRAPSVSVPSVPPHRGSG